MFIFISALSQGRSQKFILGGYNFLLHDTTVLYTIAAWRHRLQLVHKIILRDWFWEGMYTDIPPSLRAPELSMFKSCLVDSAPCFW